MKFIGSGKVKDLYDPENNDDTILFKFSDRVSAYDVKFTEDIQKKEKCFASLQSFGLMSWMFQTTS